MDSARSIAFSALLGLIVAVSIIAATTMALPSFPSSSIATSGTTRSVSVSATNETTSKTSSSPNQLVGTLSALLTDPVTVPLGVSAVYMRYSNLVVHESGLENGSQYWVQLGDASVVDLMQLVNVSQTIGLGRIAVGTTVDSVAFNVSSVNVTFDGQNYSADPVLGQSNRLNIPISGGIIVNASQPNAILIDMSPKILLLGASTNPSFAFLPNDQALVVPSNSVPLQARFLGQRHNLEQDPWWKNVVANTKFAIASIYFTPFFLEVNVTNTGSVPVIFRLASVTPGALNYSEDASVPSFLDSAFFAINSNATLQLLSGSNKAEILQQLGSSQYVLSPHASVSLTYNGAVNLGAVQYGSSNSNVQAVTNGSFIVRVFGNANVAFEAANVSA